MWFWTGLFLVTGGLAVLFLYRLGMVTTKSIRAVLFVFRPGKNTDRVTADRCTGWVSHAGRFSESGVYSFTLDARLSQGEVQVLLLDQGKTAAVKAGPAGFYRPGGIGPKKPVCPSLGTEKRRGQLRAALGKSRLGT